MSNDKKVYLGDSVYATYDGVVLELTTENGLYTDPSNVIVMEPEVVDALFLLITTTDSILTEALLGEHDNNQEAGFPDYKEP